MVPLLAVEEVSQRRAVLLDAGGRERAAVLVDEAS
jgi:hypothetical protein